MDPITHATEGAIREWRQEAAKRHAISRTDPIADTLEYCASELQERVRSAAASDEYLTVDAFAALPDVRVTPQTVRTWIRAGELDAVRGARGYLIRKGTQRVAARRKVG